MSRLATTDRSGASWVRTVATKHEKDRLTQRQYDELRPREAPSARTVMRWAGASWAAVCDAAGVAPGGRRPEWSDEQCLAALRAAAATVGSDPLVQSYYTLWRASQPEPHAWPSDWHFGSGASWQRWCERAGVTAGWCETGRPQEYSDDEIFEAIWKARRPTGAVPKAAYNEYRAGHPRAPSRATIIKRFGGWADAVALAAQWANRKAPAAPRSAARRRRRAS